MEIQADNEVEAHPGSSSSSSSPPSSPSLTSASSSSPSHPQSFASSRSSQKGLSTRSSSRSSSSSSSPFSGPSSPARGGIDHAESSTGENMRLNEMNENSASCVVDPATLASSSSAAVSPTDECIVVSPCRQNSFDTSDLVGELEVHDSSRLVSDPSIESSNCAGRPEIVNEVGGTRSEEFVCSHGNSPPDSDVNRSMPDQMPSADSLELQDTCSGPYLTTPDAIKLHSRQGSAEFTSNGCNDESNHNSTKAAGYKDSNQQQLSILGNETESNNESSQKKSGMTEASTISAATHHEDPHAPCCDLQFSKTNNSSVNTVEPEVIRSFNGDNIVETAVKPITAPLTIPAGGIDSNTDESALDEINEPSKSHQNQSQEINGLPRAKTMPSGSLGEMHPFKPAGFKRSSTDKSKAAAEDNPPHTPGIKVSKKKQEKLVKQMATLQKDGTVELDLDLERSARFASDVLQPDDWRGWSYIPGDEDDRKPIHPLQIAMLIVGTRGDVQPFVAIGKRLQEHGHRVRLATHSNFQEFVLKAGLEFYPLGGDPKVLAGYMVKNKGFLPSGPSEIRTQKKQLKSIINSLLPACTQPHGTGVSFKAQAIIANPPAYGHVHVAEALKVPLHIFFTMPWTPTAEFPHPLARVGRAAANRLSYQVVDSLIWWGIRGMINDFRKKKLGLRPITYLGGSQQSVFKLPTGYIWSPHLVPKPKDWGPKIDVVGFCFLNLSQDYKPPNELVNWLAAGPAPIYIGFGSLPVEDPSGMTKIILSALKETGQRGIIDKGWGGIGTKVDLPESVYLLDNCPHDWLFSQCAAVVHHGGAGTTAAGLRAACPTTIVPFFGDQAFWGARVHARGLGPHPIPVDHFSLDKLVAAIQFMLDNEVKQRALQLAEAIKEEDGVEGAVKAFHRHLPEELPGGPATLPSKIYRRVWLKSCFGHFHK